MRISQRKQVRQVFDLPYSHNIEFYAKLLNSLIVGQDERKSKLKQLVLTRSEYAEKSLQKALRTPIEGFEDTLESIQERTCKEMEVKRDLNREIVETKKSLVANILFRIC